MNNGYKSSQKPTESKPPVARAAFPVRYHIGFLVHDVARKRGAYFDKALKPLKLTRAQMATMVYLTRCDPQGVSQRELAARMSLGEVALGSMLLLLENAGYIERRQNLANRRQNLIVLTDHGYQVLGKTHETGTNVNEAILAGLSKEEIALGERILTKMRRNLIALGA